MIDLTPRRGPTAKAEWTITLACDLECSACTRASFLREPHTASMTIEDAHEFCRQASALDWHPQIIIIGGEPTMHPDFEMFVDIARGFNGCVPQVWSNGYSPKAQRRLAMVRDKAAVVVDTQKPEGSITGPNERFKGWMDDMFVSPTDMGRESVRMTCYQHGGTGPETNPGLCGISVDHDGYAPCALGGAIESLLRVGGRTKVLADLFDQDKAAKMSEELCRHCGFQGTLQGFLTREQVDSQPKRFGTPLSPTWEKAFEARK